MRSRTLVLIFALLLGTTPGLAGSGGSAYSIYGLGDIRYPTGVRSLGMGYTGIAVPGTGYIDGLSPATWASIRRVDLDASLLYEGFQSTDGTRSRYLARADFNGAMLAIPISAPHGIVLAGGFLPFSSVNYDAYTSESFITAADTFQYSVNHAGTGGITRGTIGLSYAPFSGLALGFSANALFGSIDYQKTQIPQSSTYSGGQATSRLTLSGVTFTLGGLLTGLDNIIPALHSLSLGAVITSRGVLSSRSQVNYRFTNADVTTERDTTPEIAGRTIIPMAYGVGMSYQAGERLLVAADYFAQLWSGTTINDLPEPSLHNSFRFGVGAEWQPSRDPFSRWINQSAFRFGLYYYSTYYQPSGLGIEEGGVTLGAGFPFSGESRVNIALEYGKRGTTDQGLVRDTILRLSASINISAIWFVQYPEN